MIPIEKVLKGKVNRIKSNDKESGEFSVNPPLGRIHLYVKGETLTFSEIDFTYLGKGEDGPYYFEWKKANEVIQEKNETI